MLGSTRLSIIDPSAKGHQPMLDSERETAIVYNGMLYNFRELRRELAAGAVFSSRCDTEVVLRAYGHWGDACVERFRGDRVGCAADLVVDGRNGFVVPSHDRGALVRVLATLVESAELRQRFGRASIETINPSSYDRTAAGLCAAVAAAVGAERWSRAG